VVRYLYCGMLPMTSTSVIPAPAGRCCLELRDGLEESAARDAQHRVEPNRLSVLSFRQQIR
jgi:hypothetical protein